MISAGVYNSPAILQRSGIGPADWLRPLGIAVAADLPVGRNLLDHPGFPMIFRAKGLGVTTGRFFAANVRGPANADGEPEWQTHPFPIDEEEDIAGLWTYLTRQEAEGEVRILGADPKRPPLIDHRYNTRQRDRDRFAAARAFCKEMLATRSHAGPRRRLDRRHRPADRGGAHRTHGRRPSPGRHGPRWDRRAIRGRSSGPTSASTASTTSRVADTSIYPDNVMHNTNLTALVVGEKAARLVAGASGDAEQCEAGCAEGGIGRLRPYSAVHARRVGRALGGRAFSPAIFALPTRRRRRLMAR